LAFRDAGDTGQWKTMRLKIVQAGEPVLRAQARQLTLEEIITDEIQQLIRDMRETMRDAPGVGLAAPQVGMTLQLAVIEDHQSRVYSPRRRHSRFL
jgi:peptide deformylase